MASPPRREIDPAPINELLAPYERRPVPADFDPSSRANFFQEPPSRAKNIPRGEIHKASLRLQNLYTSGRISSDEFLNLCHRLALLIAPPIEKP